MTTYFIEGRVYRPSDDRYWTIGLQIETMTIQDAITVAEAFNAGLATQGGFRFLIEKAATSKARGREYFILTGPGPERLRGELRNFLEGK